MPAEEEPEPPRIRFLRRLVYVLTGLLFAAIIVAITGIAVKLATGDPEGDRSDALPYESAILLAPGESLVDSLVERGLIYLRIVDGTTGGARIVVVRASNGARVGEVSLRPPP